MSNNTSDFIGDGAKSAQCAALLHTLKQHPVSTVWAREHLGISSPASRAYDLKRRGHQIVTTRSKAQDAQGRSHTTAIYTLAGSEAA